MNLYRREIYLSKIRGFMDAPDIIKVITGVRRCGKSSLMATIVEELKEKGVKEDNIAFFNLDKRPYKNIVTADALEKIIDGRFQGVMGLKYLFIDELQNVKDFEPLINGYREDGDYSIFITGSNSYLLSGQLVTKLTGRYIEFEMFPLSYEEYLGMKQFYSLPISNNAMEEFAIYARAGGFPRSIFFSSPTDRDVYVRETAREIVEKDVYKRIKVRNRESFRLFSEYLINNFSSPMNLNNIIESLEKSGTPFSYKSAVRYLAALLDAKIIYECPRFDLKSKKSLKGEKKYYLSDLSFAYLNNPDARINYGPVLENMIFLYAKSRGYTVSVGKIGKCECDFILRSPELRYAYVQVCYSIANKETEEREYRSLEAIKDNYPKYLLTTDFLLEERNGIIHRNLLSFMEKGESF